LIVNSRPVVKPEILFPHENVESLPSFYSPCKTLSTDHYVDNINVFTQFGNLTPIQILTVFNQFINWPEYESCAFVDMLEKALIKLHTKADEAEDDIAEIDLHENEENEHHPI
jgi:dimethyladenosine transferase 2